MRAGLKAMRPARRQVPLFPVDQETEEANVADAKPELVEALADLLLEALGANGGSDHEPEDHT